VTLVPGDLREDRQLLGFLEAAEPVSGVMNTTGECAQ
jgi:hypothetical protein